MHKRYRLNHMKLLLIVLLCFIWSKQALAHDPGLSTAEIRVNQSVGLTVQLTISPSDLQGICQIDTKRDQRRSTTEFEACVLQAAGNAIELWSDKQPLTLIETKATYDSESSAVSLTLGFSGPIGTHFELRSKVLQSMPRGHKQFVTLKDNEGHILTERMLSVSDSSMSYDFDSHSAGRASSPGFLLLGIEHILTGYDHLMFLLALLLVTNNFWSVGKVVSSFTIAHSLTLALATFGLLQIPARIVEPLIAVSIVYVCMENLRQAQPRNRWLLTFGFGLIHGLGFASVLRDLGIGQSGRAALLPLVSFNLGVEFGQLGVAALVLPVIWQLKKRPEFNLRYAPACSAVIGVVGCYWVILRVIG